MTVSIHYRPTTGQQVGGADNHVISALLLTFQHGFPLTLNESHIDTLKAMAIAYNRSPNPYQQLVEGIERFGSIQVMAEW